MNIRPAQPGDLPALLEIFAHARAFMAQTGNPTQWPATYPGAELMQQIARGVCYVLEGNARPEATFCYIPGPEPTYAEIYDGGWPDDAPYATIHRMASAGRVHGAAAICFAWCAARGLPLRADTHADNKVMQHLLEKNGFVRCGNITLADGTSRIAAARGQTANCCPGRRSAGPGSQSFAQTSRRPAAGCIGWPLRRGQNHHCRPDGPAIRLGCGALG